MIPILTRSGEVSNMKLDTPRQGSFITRWKFRPGPLTVKEILEQFLRENGFDGLFNEHECGCYVDGDFMICGGEYIDKCMPGYKVRDGQNSDSYMICETREVSPWEE